MYRTDRGMMPSNLAGLVPSQSLSFSFPAIVYVLPEPVCPYANTVAEKPSSAESSRAVTPLFSKHCGCVVFSSKQPSSANFLTVCREFPWKSSSFGSSTCSVVLSDPMRTTSSSPASVSV